MNKESNLYPPLPVVIVDDEKHALQGYEMLLLTEGINHVVPHNRARDVLDYLSHHKADLLLLDLCMPDLSGEELMDAVIQQHPETLIIVVTATNEVDTAVSCMKKGAFDYVVKPLDQTRFLTAVRRALETSDLRRENNSLRERVLNQKLKRPEIFNTIVTRNEAMLSIFRYIEVVAGSTQPILITGETGAGKELVARAIHRASERKGTWVPVNVAGLDDTAFADTLFGHKRGAFTDAHGERSGLINKAAGGTLFLDEIADVSLLSQIKLLRLLQEREFYPLGADTAVFTDARIVLATNQDLKKAMAEGRLRKDLYYRLITHHIHLPALRERRDDVLPLADCFLEQAARDMARPKPDITESMRKFFMLYSFPGNVRELQALIFDAVSRNDFSRLAMECIPQADKEYPHMKLQECTDGGPLHNLQRLPTLRESEQWLVAKAMEQTEGNVSMAAQMLGISRMTLHRKLKKRSIDHPPAQP